MQAFAPGSVTAVFAPAASGDESKGASVAVADGVVADVRPAAAFSFPDDASRVAVDGEPTDFEPVEIALRELGVAESARVDLIPEIPIGRGFGASGAATLATLLAANAEFELGHSREDLLATAHRAEVEAGTGLGDVFVQHLGGLVVGDGTERRRFERETPVEYASFGPIATEEALADDDLMDRIAREGTAALDALPDAPTLAHLARKAWAFAQAIDLPTKEVEDAVREVEDAGGAASMAMVGETVFAVGVEGVLANRTQVCPKGAHLL
jgi:pantoate kinase